MIDNQIWIFVATQILTAIIAVWRFRIALERRLGDMNIKMELMESQHERQVESHRHLRTKADALDAVISDHKAELAVTANRLANIDKKCDEMANDIKSILSHLRSH